MALTLPDFPWDTLQAAKRRAAEHPDGIVDLSVGTPVDPTPQILRDALAQASDAHGYPQVYGTPDLREGVAEWFARRRNARAVDPDGVMPTIGSKELVAWLPTMLGLGAGDVVGFPSVAYPTYDIGARLAGARSEPVDGLLELGPSPFGGRLRLLWLNTPGNPDGSVLGVDHLRKVVEWARSHNVIVASDECYAELDWREGAAEGGTGDGKADGPTTPSLLDDRVTGGSLDGLLAVYSLSKQSNLAGYRAAFVAGDPRLVKQLVEIRRHAGMMLPWPIQRVMLAALGDEEHVAAQKERYRARRAQLKGAFESIGWRIDHSDAGLYLWVSADEPCRTTIDRLAEVGVLAAPGDFYGRAGERHVRVALTATDERIAAAAGRIAQLDRR